MINRLCIKTPSWLCLHFATWLFLSPHGTTYLAGKEMPADFHKDLVVLVWSLVPRHDDLSARTVLKLIYLGQEQKKKIIISASMVI